LTYDPDIDGDGIPNEKDDDIDGDGVPNEYDQTMYGKVNIEPGLKPRILADKYHDGDITRPIKDPYDVNGDGIPNSQQMGMYDDLDGDGIPNYLDPDIDGDGIPNALDPTPYGAIKAGSGKASGYGAGNSYGAGAGVNSGSGYGAQQQSFDEEGLSVYFSTGKYDISTASYNVLATVARTMQAHPNYQLEIHAYCDEQGERSNFGNQRLSESRAKKVRDTLVNKYGVGASKIVLVKGHGAIQGPTIDYLPNRRADITFVR
jgi:outer membrane protein OmpA-like peptidoglycan-associated protein